MTDVGNRNPEPQIGSIASRSGLDEHGVVVIARTHRIDGHERQRRQITALAGLVCAPRRALLFERSLREGVTARKGPQ